MSLCFVKYINIDTYFFPAKAAIPQIGKCRVPLPVLRVKYKRHRPSPTIDDLPNIREKVKPIMSLVEMKYSNFTIK